MNGCRKGLYVIWVVWVVGFLGGCAGPFRSRKPLPMVRPDVLVYQIQDHASHLLTFQGRAWLTVVSPLGSFRGSMRVSAKTPDSLWMKVEGPLGIDMMTGRFAGERVLLYSPLENVAYEGSIQQLRERDVLPIDMGSSDLVLGMVGLLIPDDEILGLLTSFTSDSRKYVFDLGGGEQIWVEPRGPVVTRWEKRDGNGEILWVWEGKEFKEKRGVRLPRMIRITEYNRKQRVTLFFEAVKTNHPIQDGWCQIRIPEGVETIELEY